VGVRLGTRSQADAGEYRVRKSYLKPLHEEALRGTQDFAHFIAEHRSRTDPDIAKVDALVNNALDTCS
jgi:hypothetical protein